MSKYSVKILKEEYCQDLFTKTGQQRKINLLRLPMNTILFGTLENESYRTDRDISVQFPVTQSFSWLQVLETLFKFSLPAAAFASRRVK